MKYFGKNILHHDLEFKKGNVSGSVESSGSFGRIDSTTLSISEIKGNFTNAGNTIADLGVVTTVDINGGSIDGTSIGTNDAITQLTVDNVDINGNAINATSGDLTLTADGGDILIDNENVVGTALDKLAEIADVSTLDILQTVESRFPNHSYIQFVISLIRDQVRNSDE